MISSIFLSLYRVWAVGLFGVYIVVLSPLIVFSFVFGEKTGSRLAYFFLNVWAIGWATMSGIRYKVSGLEHFNHEDSYVFVANHNSFLDSPAMVWAIPNKFRPLGKIEITRVPIFGWMYRHVVILIDRSNGRSRLASVVEMKKRLQEGTSILIFAEGTMNKNPKETPLQVFQDGAFKIAIDTQTTIVPLLIEGSGELLHPLEGLRVRPGTIKLTFLPPIPVEGLQTSDTAKLKQQVFDLMRQAQIARENNS